MYKIAVHDFEEKKKKKKKDRLIGTEYVLRQTEEEEGTDVQPGSKLGVSKVKLDV